MDPGKSTCAACAGLIRLCGGLDFFPADTEVRKLLVDRLHHFAKNHDHATAMIETWLNRERVAPKIADIVSLAAEVHSNKQALPLGCDLCRGGGELWVVTESGASRCTCARGKALRAKDLERNPA
jgi:hypothetical protein